MLPQQNIPPKSGMLLIAGANLLDPNFTRTIILLCEHRFEGSFGLVLNQPVSINLSDVVKNLDGWDAPLHRGGPVQENTLHFIHRCPDLDIGSQKILPGLYWGGEFEKLSTILRTGRVDANNFRFFIGYSGWGEGQLMDEVERDSWYLKPADLNLIFFEDAKNQWRQSFVNMGPDYQMLSNFPDDPRLN